MVESAEADVTHAGLLLLLRDGRGGSLLLLLLRVGIVLGGRHEVCRKAGAVDDCSWRCGRDIIARDWRKRGSARANLFARRGQAERAGLGNRLDREAAECAP